MTRERRSVSSGLRSWVFACVSVALVSSASPALQDRTAAGSFAFVHVSVIDGTGAGPRTNQTVLIAGGRIQAVAESASVTIPSAARIIDATGQVLIPGLWDAHVHTRYAGIDHLRLMLANGITGARDMGGGWEHFQQLKTWRTAIARGDRPGPHLVAGAVLLDGPGSVWSHAAIIRTPEEGRTAVRRLKSEGADFVKVYDRLSHESFGAIVDEAKSAGLAVAGHVPEAITVLEASDAGIRSIEHLSGIVVASSTRAEELAARRRDGQQVRGAQLESYSPAKAREIGERLKRSQTRVAPTLVSLVSTPMGIARKDPAIVRSDRLRYVPAAYRDAWMSATGGSGARQLEVASSIIRELHAAGVEIVAGTDFIKPFVVPGFSLHDELSLLVRAGLPEMSVLEAATRKAARLAGADDRGTIERGMVADLVLLDGSPLENIDNTRRIAAVVSEGRLMDRVELQAMLADVEREAQRWDGVPTGR